MPRSGADEQPGRDFGVREAVTNEPYDLGFLSGEFAAGFARAFAGGFAGCP
jgi:hypothetical protein